jgi:hypothetical protein
MEMKDNLEERFQKKIDMESKIEPKDWMPPAYFLGPISEPSVGWWMVPLL